MVKPACVSEQFTDDERQKTVAGLPQLAWHSYLGPLVWRLSRGTASGKTNGSGAALTRAKTEAAAREATKCMINE